MSLLIHRQIQAELIFQEQSETNTIISKELVNIPITKALAGIEDVFEDVYDYNGNEILAATIYLDETDLGMVVKIEEEEALLELRETFNNI